MAGIYLHIPFCKQACHYCDFHFTTSLKRKAELLDALEQEIDLRKDYLNQQEVASVYLGGGTPSLLNAGELNRLFEALHRHHRILPEAEITLEANPDDLSVQYLQSLRETPVNRLSIGVQSFRDEDLQWMNRAHSAREAIACIRESREAGIDNLTIDLIYGVPGLDPAAWEANLEQVFALEVPHLSAYALTVESRTALAASIQKGTTQPLDEAQAQAHMVHLMTRAPEAGYAQYEISNFAREGRVAVHNSNYWRGKHYLGIGPSAHSFNGRERHWIVANNARYMASIKGGTLPLETEVLRPEDHYNERVMTGLRTAWGCDLAAIVQDLGQPFADHALKEARPYLHSGHLIHRENALLLTERGKLLADRIASDLFYIT